MLYLIQDLSDQYAPLLKEDPVRPSIPIERRLGTNKNVFVLCDHDHARAVTCVSYQPVVPRTESELFSDDPALVAVFYTIWSYSSGAGRELILAAVDYIKSHRPDIQRFVTLSPKTEMARNFHLRNGAGIYQDNAETVNYEYRVR